MCNLQHVSFFAKKQEHTLSRSALNRLFVKFIRRSVRFYPLHAGVRFTCHCCCLPLQSFSSPIALLFCVRVLPSLFPSNPTTRSQMPSSYVLLSIPSEPSPSAVLERMRSRTSPHGLKPIEIPTLLVGTLDSLMNLTDALQKSDQVVR